MRRLALVTAPLALAACGNVAPSEEAEGVSATADAALPPSRGTSTPQPSGLGPGTGTGAEGLAWFYKPESNTAIFGPPQSEGLLSIRCDTSRTGTDRRILVTRYAPAGGDAAEKLSFRGKARTARIPVASQSNEMGPDSFWQGTVPLPASELRRVFVDNDGLLSVELENGDLLEVPVSPEPLAAIDACL